jgi:hypothetical protein
MKRVVVVGLAVLSLGLVGCTLADLLNLAGAPDRECPDPGSKGTMTAKVAGADFESCNTTISGAPNSSYVLHGLSGEAVPSEILITVVASEGPGTYAFGGASGNGDTNAVYINSEEMLSGNEEEGSYVTKDDVESGSIVFTTLDGTKAVGTFSFTGTRESDGTTTKEVTDGAFDVEF